MTWLTFIIALLTAPTKMTETRAADPRMQCEWVHVEDFGVHTAYCSRALGRTADGKVIARWVESEWAFSWEALGLREPRPYLLESIDTTSTDPL